MLERVKTALSATHNRLPEKLKFWLPYLTAALACTAAYYPVRAVMTDQSTSYMALTSDVTVNLILILFFWGVTSDRLTKSWPKWKGWALFFVGMAVLILFFRLVGDVRTIFG